MACDTPIVDGLVLQGFDFATEYCEPSKFAHQFRKLWAKIPEADRRVILRRPPRIELVNGWSSVPDCVFLGNFDPDRPQALAECGHSGRVLRFLSPVCEVLPGHLLRTLIGHELAHVVQFAAGFLGRFGTLAPDVQTVEDDANRIATSWGCKPDLLAEWQAEHWGPEIPGTEGEPAPTPLELILAQRDYDRAKRRDRVRHR